MARYSFLLALAAIAACTIPSAAPPGDTTPPTGAVLINNDDSYTVSTSVTLALSAADDDAAGVTQMRVSNTADFAGAGWQSFAASLTWTLTDGDGPKIVYAAFRDAAGNPSEVSSDSIALDTTLPGPPDPPDLAEEDDTGLDNSDNVTRQTSGLTFSGTVDEPGVTAVHLYDTTRGWQASVDLDPLDLGAWSLELSLEEGTYALYVKTKDIVGLSPSSWPPLALVVDTTPPAAPSLLKPALGENTGANKRPVFAWMGLAEAGSYELQVDDSADFSSPEHHWTNLSGTSYTPGSDLAASASVPVGTRYYLRMRAVDAAGDASRFGFSVATAGDVDHDGYGDLLIGAYYWSGAAGKAYLYRGGPSMDTLADLALYGAGTLAGYFGYSAASAGDVNGDGYADMVVGAYGENGSNGRAYLFRGGAALDATSDLTMSATAYFGFSVAWLDAAPRRRPT